MNSIVDTFHGTSTTSSKEPASRSPALQTVFLRECVRVPLDRLLLLKTLKPGTKETQKYQQILASVQEIGLVEPPAVVQAPKQRGYYLLIDGQLRIAALKDLGVAEVDCLVALSDDTYSYNKHISRIAAVQEHRMIVRGMDSGLSPERLSKTLYLSPKTIRDRFRMLHGICDEVVHLMADVECPRKVFDVLRQMTPLRQMEAAELMIGQRNLSIMFAQALLAASQPDQLVPTPTKRLQDPVVSGESIARLERELSTLQMQVKAVEENYGPDQAELTIIQNYVSSLLNSAPVVRWLSANRRDYLTEFQNITDMKRLPVNDDV